MRGVRYYRTIPPFGPMLVEFQNEPERIALMLRAANVRAVTQAYGDKHQKPEPYAYRPDPGAAHFAIAPVQIIKAVHCLDYQCRDSKGWIGCEARTALIALEQAAIRALPGYEPAQWELRREGSPS